MLSEQLYHCKSMKRVVKLSYSNDYAKMKICIFFFKIEISEIGRIFKIRLSLEYLDSDWSGWFVEKIVLENSRKEQVNFNCNRYLVLHLHLMGTKNLLSYP